MISAIALALLLAPNTIYVGPNGSDTNPGTGSRPLSTLGAAVEAARLAHAHRIVLQRGRYRVQRTVALDARDNGLTIEGNAVLTGGLEIPASAIKPCTDEAVLGRIIDGNARQSVREVELLSLHVYPVAIEPRGFPHAAHPSPNELFHGGTPMHLARWPNDGYAKVEEVIEPGNGEEDRDKPPRQPVFRAGERAKLWTKADAPWLYGYWKYDWADESIRASNIGSDGKITLERPHVYGVAKGAEFFAENLLEELDAPGEYYIDSATRKLYFIPEPDVTPGASDTYELSTLGEPMFTAKGASNIKIQGLTLHCSRGDGAQLSGCTNVTLDECRFADLGERAATFDGCKGCGLTGCTIVNTGEGGVVLGGGDRKTLTPGGNFVERCDISNYERRSQTYRPAVLLQGDGNRVSHCTIHDAPHSAIIFSGNNHLIEHNEFFRTISRTGDGGVVYTGRDWSARGTAIRFNHFHDNIGQRKWEPAIYVDDLGSGIQVYGNLIERCHWGFLIGGGRDNIIENNVLIDCDLGFDCDDRGLGWGKSMLPTLTANLQAMPYQSDTWRREYPTLADILTRDPLAPMGNAIHRNLLIRSGALDQQMAPAFKKGAEIKDNYETNSMPSGDFLHDPHHSIWRHVPGFKPLPW